MTEASALAPRPAPSSRPAITPYLIHRSDRCINCGACIEACIYDCHVRSSADPRELDQPKADCCRHCFACLMRCPRHALSMQLNEAYLAMGDETYTPGRIRSIKAQAERGQIPVSGAGYDGVFDGDYYDNIWTDMSEIVRPTRDGIHGREHISTSVPLGRLVSDLCGMAFDWDGNLKSQIPPNREISIPVIFGSMPFVPQEAVVASLALAASRLTTYVTVHAGHDLERYRTYFNHLLIRLGPEEIDRYTEILEWATIIEIDAGGDHVAAIGKARRINPHLLTVIRVPAAQGVEETILDLARDGAETVHLSAGIHGRGADGTTLLGGLRAAHLRLVDEGIRDRITLVASGGIAAAEHIPKTILMGADAVMVDIPLLVAMEAVEWTPDANKGKTLRPGNVDGLDPRWGATRVINLMLSWRDQLLEVLGAMGLRDVRRLRGETGRAIFADQARARFLERLRQPVVAKPRACTRQSEDAAPGEPLAHVRAAPAPQRFNGALGAWHVVVDRERCTDCGLCVESCRLNVHRRPEGKVSLDQPVHALCIGPSCKGNDWCCVHVCPFQALSIEADPVSLVLGDPRWTPDLLRHTWHQTRSGGPPDRSPEAQAGASRGGFDSLRLATAIPGAAPVEGPVDLSIPLNRRAEGPRIAIPVPIYGGGMSYGSVSLQVMVGRAMAARRIGTFTCTGEGGYPDALVPYADHVITQVATGLFGVREETIRRARMVEFKYAQGAKPGLGGHLLGEKNTQDVASMREAVPGTNLFSPFPFHSVYSVEDHKKHVDWIRAVHPDALVSVKVSTPADVDMVAVGVYYAGANVIHLDGAYGGTGAAPDIAKKNIAQPIEYATIQTHEFLVNEGIRDDVVLIVSGGIRSPEDVLKAIALGADGVVIGTAELVAIDCVRCGNCERDRGCPIGIATTDRRLAPQMTAEWVCARITNLYKGWALYLDQRLRALGMRSVLELRGRVDLLEFCPGGPSNDRDRASVEGDHP